MIRPADRGLGTPLTFEEQRAMIALSLVPGVGPGRIRILKQAFGSAEGALSAPSSALARVEGIGPQTAQRIAAFDAEDVADRQIEMAARAGAEMVTFWDDRYPYLLAQIYDPPAFLWVRGRLPDNETHQRSLAIVGTRRPTDYGKRVAHAFALALARAGFTIVSGLAYGVDGAAHGGAVEADGCTVAVLGSGVDRIYPGRHTRLADQIIEGRGAVISEYPMGASPEAPNFPRRNRVVSGLARGTLVVEAYEDGGALITARLAVEQNRDVFAIPGPVHSRSSAGANRLIQTSGARLVQSPEDILEEFGFAGSTAEGEALDLDSASLEPEERAICDVLSTEPVHIDRICNASGLDPATALVYLLNLEFKGIVRQLAGKQFFLTYS